MGRDLSSYQFREEVYEIAFGDNAINRGFSDEEVIEKLFEYSQNALNWEEYIENK